MTVFWAPAQTATVFGGTGFLGRRVVRRLREAGFAVRFAARHPERGRSLFADGEPGIASIRADINEESAVAAAIAGSYAVVNAVSLYVERGKDTFRLVHVEAAGHDRGFRRAQHRARKGRCRYLPLGQQGRRRMARRGPHLVQRGGQSRDPRAVAIAGDPLLQPPDPSSRAGPRDALRDAAIAHLTKTEGLGPLLSNVAAAGKGSACWLIANAAAQGPKVGGLSAGGKWIRTIGSIPLHRREMLWGGRRGWQFRRLHQSMECRDASAERFEQVPGGAGPR